MARRFARALLGGAALAACGLTGCAGTYDMITSQRFKDRPFHTLFVTEDPMEVLEKSTEGDARVRAMRNLKEPKENGGTAAQQDRAIAILQEAATQDQRPLVRLAAVEALARFKDPRVGPILVASYHSVSQPPAHEPEITTVGALSGVKGAFAHFTPDTITSIQSLTLESLGQHRTPEGLQLLVQAASTPVERKPKPASAIEPAGLFNPDADFGTGIDRIDVRLAAIRALGSYDKDPTAIRALVTILKTDRDVAVRGRAHDSLVSITGQDLPADGNAWQTWLDKGGKQ